MQVIRSEGPGDYYLVSVARSIYEAYWVLSLNEMLVGLSLVLPIISHEFADTH